MPGGNLQYGRVGGSRSLNPFVQKFDEEQEQQRLAESAAAEIVARKPRDMNAAAPWWRRYFDKIEEKELAANLQGKNFRADFGGFGNATSVKQGGQTVARSGGSPFARPGSSPADETDRFHDNMAAVDAQLARGQQLRSNSYALVDQANASADAARGRLESGDFDLFSGRAGKRAGAIGDVNRSEFARDASTRAKTYFDPDVTRQREAQVADEERLLTARYGREADAQAKVEAARIAAQGKVDTAGVTAGGAQNREYLRALMKAREQAALFGGDPAASAGFENELRGNIPGMQPNAGMGIDEPSFAAYLSAGHTPAGRQQLIEMWPNLSPEQQARVRTTLGRR